MQRLTLIIIWALYFAGFVGAQAQDIAFLTNGLVAYFPFDGNANDASGNKHDGLAKGAVLAPDRFGHAASAYAFNGLDSEISVPSADSLNLVGNMTATCWFLSTNPPVTANAHALLAKRYDNGVCCGANVPYDFAINFPLPPKKPNFILAAAKGGQYQFAEPVEGAIPTNTWHFAAVVVNGEAAQFFLDGRMVGAAPFPAAGRVANNAPLTIGSVGRERGAEFMNGALDDVRLFNRALSVEEIQRLHAYEAGPFLQITVSKVKVRVTGLSVGRQYQFLSTVNFTSWTKIGSPFIAQSTETEQEFDVTGQAGKNFQIQEIP
jgi:hypothetical protein